MMNSDLPDLLAARAAGEDAPDIDPAEVDRRLSESQAARDELDGLTGLVSLLRAQQGAPDARRLAQLDLALDRQTRPSPWPRRLAMAAAVLLTVGLLVSGLYWDLRLRSHRTPAVAVTPKVPSHSSPQPPAPHAWLEQLVTDVHVAPPDSGRQYARFRGWRPVRHQGPARQEVRPRSAETRETPEKGLHCPAMGSWLGLARRPALPDCV